jgi:chemotaxis protein MotA
MTRLARLDLSAIAGLVAGAILLAWAQVLGGGALRSLWQPSAALIVFGGTAAAIVISYPSTVLRKTAVAVRQAVVSDKQMPTEPLLDRFFLYADLARRKGLLSLENEVDAVRDPFLRAALGLIVDGENPKVCRQILEIESHALREGAERSAEVLETAAGFAPTLGILGAVLGLIHVMDNISEPSKLGAGIAVAFVATVYGVGIANLLLLPLANKIRGVAQHAATAREVVIEGAVALQEGLNPRLVDQKLRGLVAPGTVRPRRRSLA